MPASSPRRNSPPRKSSSWAFDMETAKREPAMGSLFRTPAEARPAAAGRRPEGGTGERSSPAAVRSTAGPAAVPCPPAQTRKSPTQKAGSPLQDCRPSAVSYQNAIFINSATQHRMMASGTYTYRPMPYHSAPRRFLLPVLTAASSASFFIT